jgi:hypothetical protein
MNALDGAASGMSVPALDNRSASADTLNVMLIGELAIGSGEKSSF